jgi:hypothetical protein
MYKIDKNGDVYEYDVDLQKINVYVQEVKQSLTEDYYALEKVCKQEAEYNSTYTSLFMRSTVSLPIERLTSKLLGRIPNYQYYESVFFNNNFRVYNTLKVRINSDFKVQYFIEDVQERLPMILIKEIKKIRNLVSN